MVEEEPGHPVQQCSRCGRVFRKGQTRYLVTISVVADFDGTIEPPGGPGEIRRMWTEIEGKSEAELLGEVAQKFSYTLCKPCRDLWAKSPLGGPPPEGEPLAGHVH